MIIFEREADGYFTDQKVVMVQLQNGHATHPQQSFWCISKDLQYSNRFAVLKQICSTQTEEIEERLI